MELWTSFSAWSWRKMNDYPFLVGRHNVRRRSCSRLVLTWWQEKTTLWGSTFPYVILCRLLSVHNASIKIHACIWLLSLFSLKKSLFFHKNIVHTWRSFKCNYLSCVFRRLTKRIRSRTDKNSPKKLMRFKWTANPSATFKRQYIYTVTFIKFLSAQLHC